MILVPLFCTFRSGSQHQVGIKITKGLMKIPHYRCCKVSIVEQVFA